MKIILIYTARSGSTSILKYFSKLKPEFECFNEPWFPWMITNVYNGERIEYDELIKKNNIFVKTTPVNCPVSFETLIKDFDKVLFLLRKNKKEQVESNILLQKESSFLDTSKRKYKTFNITEHEMEIVSEKYDNLNTLIETASSQHSLPLFYYEDLYYGSFDKLFSELELPYDEKYYQEFLNISNRYRTETVEVKKDYTII